MAELLFQSKQEKLPDSSPIIITKILGAIDGTTVRQFEDKLIGFFNQGVKNLILIFSDVKYINSTGMGLLVKLADKFQEGGGDIKLVGVPEKVIALFDMLGLLSLFKIYETEEDAVDSIAKPKAAAAAPAAAKPAAKPAAPPPAPRPAAPTSSQPKASPPPPPPAPKPAPAPAPAPAASESFEIGGGIEIGAEGESSAAASPVSWPHDASCSNCNGPIQFPAQGNYKCPRCNSFLSINECGQQTVYSTISSKIVELKFPCDNMYATSVKAAVNALAQQMGFSQVFNDEINLALENALLVAVEKSNQGRESYQILAVADSAEMILGIQSLNPFLVQGGPKDPRLLTIAKKVDRLEVFPLPNKGQLLKMTKKRK